MADDDNTNPDASKTTDADKNADTDQDSQKDGNPPAGENGGTKAAGDKSAGDKSADGGSGDDGDNSDKGGSGSTNNTPPLSTALNPQIVQAVGTTNHAVLNGAFPGANGVAYQKVAQAAAYAVQDSTDYLRNIMSMASATTGVAMQQMLVKKEVSPYADIIKAATQAVTDAQKTFSNVGESASSVVKDFDSLA
ncbi:hypothetical protein [Thalassospira povalilytica]|uniref:hypothetical protein n=1 Tax=Thalassospira povalilytica TaxID=732237 RepID=UPI001D1952FA|nr:hypothetical protein [Thalassospira povalilytica]MCC4242711.1 hypothetical protein [Thalassospira povalilytica]